VAARAASLRPHRLRGPHRGVRAAGGRRRHPRASTARPPKPTFATALAKGMHLMREDGERLIAQGITSREEVLRVTRD
jgi:hypothetical protein